MKQINEIIDKTKRNLNKIEFDFDFDFKKVFVIIKTIINELKRKISDFLKRFENVFNFKKTKNLFSHRFYDHKIEFIDDSIQLFRSKMYFLFSKQFETFQKYFHENFQKKFINSNKFFMFRQFYSQSSLMINLKCA